MSIKNFNVKNGLTVGVASIDASSGNIVAGNANLGNLATANFFGGNANALFNIQGANVVGTVANANTAQTNSIISKRSAIAVTNATVVDTFAKADYRSAKYIVSSQNDDGFESLEVLLVHNDINSFITVYGAINDNGNTVAITTGINSGNVELRATGLAANTEIKLIGTYVPVI